MSHEVESMFSVGELPWHGLGVNVEEAPSIEEGIELSGLDWEVKTFPVFTEIPNPENPDEPIRVELKKGRVSMRTDNYRELGAVGPRWTPLQNVKAFETFQPMIESGDMELHTAGSLRDGERIWVLCKLTLDNQEIVKGDEVSAFALLSNGHDGLLGVHFGFTPIRVVCANTEAMARSCKGSKLIRIRHHANVEKNVKMLGEIMDVTKQDFAATAEQYRFLASRAFNQKDIEKYVRIVLDKEAEKRDPAKDSTRFVNICKAVTKLAETGKGNDLQGVRGTAWAAYNAVSEHLNYHAGRNNANRMNALWFGTGAATNERALEVALKMADYNSAA